MMIRKSWSTHAMVWTGSWVTGQLSWLMGHVGHRSQNVTHCQL